MVILSVAPLAEGLEVALEALAGDSLGDALLFFPLADLLFDLLKLFLLIEFLLLSQYVALALEYISHSLANVINLVQKVISFCLIEIVCHFSNLFSSSTAR